MNPHWGLKHGYDCHTHILDNLCESLLGIESNSESAPNVGAFILFDFTLCFSLLR